MLLLLYRLNPFRSSEARVPAAQTFQLPIEITRQRKVDEVYRMDERQDELSPNPCHCEKSLNGDRQSPVIRSRALVFRLPRPHETRGSIARSIWLHTSQCNRLACA